MLNAIKFVIPIAIIALSDASASAATMHRPHANATTAATAFGLSPNSQSRHIRETGAERYQDRGNAEGDGLQFSRS